MQKDKKTGMYPVPKPYDVAGSAHWRNKADNCVTVHRPNATDFKDKTVEIHIQKIRFKENGRLGMAVLNYDYITGNYYQPV
jgi:twinkle protein